MGISVLEGKRLDHGDTRAVLYCNTDNVAFGPMFVDGAEALAFLDWWQANQVSRLVPQDLRALEPHEIADEVMGWRLYGKNR